MHKLSVKKNKLFSPLLGAPVLILIIFSVNYAFGVDDKAMIDSPLKQMKNGVSAEDVICKAGMKLILKATDGSPACVTILTKDILVQREWAQSEGFGAILSTEPVKKEQFLKIEGDKFPVPGRGKTTEVTVSGYVEKYLSSTPVSLIITKPDNSTETQNTLAAKDGQFKSVIVLSDKFTAGHYTVTCKYYKSQVGTASFDLIDSALQKNIKSLTGLKKAK